MCICLDSAVSDGCHLGGMELKIGLGGHLFDVYEIISLCFWQCVFTG